MKILLVRAKKETDFNAVPQLGLAIICGMLRDHGHEVLVLDQLLYIGTQSRSPALRDTISEFKPDIIGFSICSATYFEFLSMLREARKTAVPILVGGPHATIFYDDLVDTLDVDYIVRGEAENVIVDLVEKAVIQPRPIVVEGSATDLAELPVPDFRSFLNWREITQYPLSTSRGCPYSCSFCAVQQMSPRGWRARDIEVCLGELELAKAALPSLDTVKVVDDCPTLNSNRFKEFLRMYTERDLGLELNVDNIRADSIDEEMVTLARLAGVTMICIGVEHGNEDVFKAIGKGETLGDIRLAARLIKRGGLRLGACFIIGLPGDSLERTWDSINLAREIEADQVIWNLAHPMEGTQIMDWYLKHGARIGDVRGYSSYEYHGVKVKQPVVETEDFTRQEREKAYFIAVVETGQFATNTMLSDLFYLVCYSFRFRYYRGITRGVPMFFRKLLGYVLSSEMTPMEKIAEIRKRVRSLHFRRKT